MCCTARLVWARIKQALWFVCMLMSVCACVSVCMLCVLCVCVVLCMCVCVCVCVILLTKVCTFTQPMHLYTNVHIHRTMCASLAAPYMQGWPEPYILTVYDHIFGDYPAINTVYTSCTHGSGQPYLYAGQPKE